VTEPAYLTETRASYDTVAESYEELVRDALAHCPLERGVFETFVEDVGKAGGGEVLDAGCGPGRITGYLHTLGTSVRGVDLSPRMVELARDLHPHLRFDVGNLTALDATDASLSGLLAWYSTIHLPNEDLPLFFSEAARVLRPGAPLLLGFHVGDDVHRRVEHAYGHDVVGYNAHRRQPDVLETLMREHGITPHLRVTRERTGQERTGQAFLLGHRAV